MTTVLCIDTASGPFALALAVDGQVVATSVQDAPRDHSKALLPAIKELLHGRPSLDGIAVVKGPGSYAGLRVGIATAEGLALAHGIPLRGIATLLAVKAASGLDDVTAIHPAGRGEFAAQTFTNGEQVGPAEALKAGDLAGLHLAGEGAGALGGMEIGPAERCRAALAGLLPAFAEGSSESIDAVYLREPNITLPRRSGQPLLAR
ncbi:MAG: tRNA (adenosine(37)-N6)-threonylcarbamoyltransferase complex dimerization subunit type 1 TsaB [Chloroflexi bacterium CFX7]|nr:tRNA (adenosine(37)-N6)-threonylcarbamoyltransferase complex dimerization subunit type 1 TsaB [Chloroflexi bacterium CFX7]MCK6564215.1 tRNA (adenosine(37)-N6)-threonylcarbamoyltransferase complex dimerization subunit type 1 TsaB [Dehalococcoidia bacterium]RIL02483.1 MAG: tRNA (adenosine(37)-N6)-threonylcarbamoyltransferase complex dimerization subunit type 1 TsaB [bacterium]